MIWAYFVTTGPEHHTVVEVIVNLFISVKCEETCLSAETWTRLGRRNRTIYVYLDISNQIKWPFRI